MAAVALGYGIPYTFISGFETISEDELNKTEETDSEEVLEGGIEADIQEAETEAEKEEPAEEEKPVETETDEIVVEGAAAEETTEE